ncbi:MAG: hypothetical protein JRG76_15780 [Deltaproteobacteria bacterium]|nr:hypothetical protein [Deltaproteobacteria bacterium]MBW2415959.1 hypothetical protein [Deltaproteobacteria bacterium]
MHGQIAQLIGSTAPADQQTVADVFGQKFQSMGSWRAFLRIQLAGNVSSALMAPAAGWKVQSFHALYIACWIHHPVEKGSFMINLGNLSVVQRKVIEAAYKKHCSGRKSSHLSGSGRSASKGWDFLNGYRELLVQYETTQGRSYLFLKAEGHTTGISGIGPHMKSWRHKKKHGVGLEASPALHALAAASPAVEARAAENFAKGYGKLLKDVLKLKGKLVTVRDMVKALFDTAGYTLYPPTFAMTASNEQIGNALLRYCADASHVGAGGLKYRAGEAITQDMINDLRTVAQSLQSDGDVHLRRVYREIRVNSVDVDQSLATFYASPGD